MNTPAGGPYSRETRMAVRSTYLVFAALGLAGATWVSRLPQIRERMDLDAASVGLLLLLIAVGGVAALPLAGTVVARVGPRRAVTAVAVLIGVGLVALAFALAEGAGSNWISLAVIDRHHTAASVGTLAYAAFLAAVTLGRWLGPQIVDRLGRPGALRAAAGSAASGVVLFAFGPGLWTGFAGALLRGAGAALGFPVGLSAGSDNPARAAVRVGVITSIGYCGFVCGPPLIGFLADRTALAPALLVVAALMAAAIPLAGAARAAPPPAHEEPAHEEAAREEAVDAGPARPEHPAHRGEHRADRYTHDQGQ
ncbi:MULTISPECIES: MFS transporter [Streptomyces]|uniref:MFS transporter n=1 Tax=Streptomyces TaxID=1883 RepID=UPI00068E7530|nr:MULTISPECIES: MFS transporter [Streptomyces]